MIKPVLESYLLNRGYSLNTNGELEKRVSINDRLYRLIVKANLNYDSIMISYRYVDELINKLRYLVVDNDVSKKELDKLFDKIETTDKYLRK